MATMHATVSAFPTSLNGISNNSWDNIFSPKPSKDEKIKTDLDLLVMSCTIYRLRHAKYDDPATASKYKCLSLIDDNIQQYVTTVDYDLADLIKEHFQQKLIILQLKAAQLTNFRSDLSKFLNSNWHTDPAGVFIYPKTFVGLAYKLPYLYFYDLEMNKIFGGDYFAIKGPTSLRGTKTLKHLTTITPHRKYQNSIEFWFEDETGNRVMITLEKHNPLINVFDKMIEGPVEIEGKFEMRMKDAMHYYHMPVWKCLV
jgi:hypothetical protein